MPVPQEIINMDKSAHQCGYFLLQLPSPQDAVNGGRSKHSRNFRVYLEIGKQSKYDVLMSEYCQQIDVAPKTSDDAQIQHAPGTTARKVLGQGNFYARKAKIAANIAKDHMVQILSQPGSTCGDRVDAGTQMEVKNDPYQYDVSYWDDVEEDIHVLFHCYPKS